MEKPKLIIKLLPDGCRQLCFGEETIILMPHVSITPTLAALKVLGVLEYEVHDLKNISHGEQQQGQEVERTAVV